MYDDTEVTCTAGGSALSIAIASQARGITLRIRADTAPASVSLNGGGLTRQATQGAFDAAPSGWRFDGGDHAVLVKFDHAGGTAMLKM